MAAIAINYEHAWCVHDDDEPCVLMLTDLTFLAD